MLQTYDIICSKPYDANDLNDGHYYKGCKERFAAVSKTSEEWYEKMRALINAKYPEYNGELLYLDNMPNHYLCNMFVMKKELYDKYCEFAFDILLNLYEDFKAEKLDIWQARAIGFLAEFITSMFISNAVRFIYTPKTYISSWM